MTHWFGSLCRRSNSGLAEAPPAPSDKTAARPPRRFVSTSCRSLHRRRPRTAAVHPASGRRCRACGRSVPREASLAYVGRYRAASRKPQVRRHRCRGAGPLTNARCARTRRRRTGTAGGAERRRCALASGQERWSERRREWSNGGALLAAAAAAPLRAAPAEDADRDAAPPCPGADRPVRDPASGRAAAAAAARLSSSGARRRARSRWRTRIRLAVRASPAPEAAATSPRSSSPDRAPSRYPPAPGFRGNPLLLFALDRDTRELSAATGGSPAWFRNRFRQALATAAELRPTEIEHRRAPAWPASVIALSPYAGEPRARPLPAPALRLRPVRGRAGRVPRHPHGTPRGRRRRARGAGDHRLRRNGAAGGGRR